MPDLSSGLIFYVVFLLSTTVHEAAHAWAAKLGGDLTAYHGGQVSLDPRPHIRREPFGMVVLPIISVLISGWPFGFASVLAAIAIRVGLAAGVLYAPESVGFSRVTAAAEAGWWQGVAFVLSVFFSLNIVLFALNILPFPPLDGSAAVPLLLSDVATERYQQFLWGQPALSWIGILIAWQIFDKVFSPIFLFAVNVLYPGVGYG